MTTPISAMVCHLTMFNQHTKFEMSMTMITCNIWKAMPNVKILVLSHPLGDLGVTHRVHLWSKESALSTYTVHTSRQQPRLIWRHTRSNRHTRSLRQRPSTAFERGVETAPTSNSAVGDETARRRPHDALHHRTRSIEGMLQTSTATVRTLH